MAEATVVKPGQYYRHFKGGHYIVLGLATLADGEMEGETVVIYRRNGAVYVRSLANFCEVVDGVQRFVLIGG